MRVTFYSVDAVAFDLHLFWMEWGWGYGLGTRNAICPSSVLNHEEARTTTDRYMAEQAARLAADTKSEFGLFFDSLLRPPCGQARGLCPYRHCVPKYCDSDSVKSRLSVEFIICLKKITKAEKRTGIRF